MDIKTDYDLLVKDGESDDVIKEILHLIWIPEVVEEFFENKK